MRVIETDDAMYIEGAFQYAKDFFGYYFTAKPPLYVMILALPIKIFGVNIFILKFFSTICYAVALFCLYKALKKRIPNTLLFPALFLVATNAVILEYASLTFTESFYMMLQSLFFLFFFWFIERKGVQEERWKSEWKYHLILGLLLFLLTLTRSIAIAGVGGIVLYFFYQRQWINALISFCSFSFWFVLFGVFKKVFWGTLAANQFAAQWQLVLQKDAYNASLGTESFSGMMVRFIENVQIYFSARMFEIFGLRPENSDPNVFLTVIMILFLAVGTYYIVMTKNKFLLALMLYSYIVCGGTFLAVQTSWGQPRYIMIFLPSFLLIGLYGLYQLSRVSADSPMRHAYVVVLAILTIAGIYSTADKANANVPILQKNLNGDIYAGFPAQWQTYIKISRWSAEHLDSSAVVACRKAPISFVYGNGRNFYGIYNVPSENPDSLLHILKRTGATHIILDAIAGTVYRYMSIIETKYPGTFQQLRQEGNDQTAAYLFRINYQQ